jgi:hypothetical protein
MLYSMINNTIYKPSQQQKSHRITTQKSFILKKLFNCIKSINYKHVRNRGLIVGYITQIIEPLIFPYSFSSFVKTETRIWLISYPIRKLLHLIIQYTSKYGDNVYERTCNM